MNDLSYLKLPKEDRGKAIDRIISFFLDELGEEIGIIAASELLDFFESDVAPMIYKKAILDSKKIVKEHFEQIDFSLTEKTLE